MSREEVIRKHAVVLARDGFIKTAGPYEKSRFCTCCKEGFEYGQQYRTFTSHMHVDCIHELLIPDGNPKIVLDFKPPSRPDVPGRIVDSLPPKTVPPAAVKVDVDGIAELVADKVTWLTDANTDALVESITEKVVARIAAATNRLEITINELKALVEEGA